MMKIYFDKTGFINYFITFIKMWFTDFKETVGWIFGFYALEKDISDQTEYVPTDTNIFKLLLFPVKLFLMLTGTIVIVLIMIIGTPIALIYNVKITLRGEK